MALSVEHFADGTNNNCDSIREYDQTDHVIWNKITARTTAVPKHHLDVVFPIVLPASFQSFEATAFSLTYKTVGTSAFVSIRKVVDSLGVEQTTGLPAAVQSTSKAQLDVLASALTGTFQANTIIYVLVRGEGNSGTPFTTETCFIGPMKTSMEAFS